MFPQSTLKSEEVDIRKYPIVDEQKPGTTLTVGDLHGNTMKLLWILIREGAIKMSKDDFQSMWEIYYKMDDSNEVNLSKFNKILKRISVKNSNFNLRLIGDVFADRGINDYLTLRVLEKLATGGINYELLYSNHDACLIDNYHKLPDTTNNWRIKIPETQTSSLLGLFKYVSLSKEKNGNEVKELVKRYIIPKVKLISYSLSHDKRTIDLFIHAPNDFTRIQKLINIFNKEHLTFNNAEELATAIDELNEKFLFYIQHPENRTRNIDYLLYNFIWERLKENEYGQNRDPNYRGQINFSTYPSYVNKIIHGHTTVAKPPKHQQNLDTQCGTNLNCTIPIRIPKDYVDAIAWNHLLNEKKPTKQKDTFFREALKDNLDNLLYSLNFYYPKEKHVENAEIAMSFLRSPDMEVVQVTLVGGFTVKNDYLECTVSIKASLNQGTYMSYSDPSPILSKKLGKAASIQPHQPQGVTTPQQLKKHSTYPNWAKTGKKSPAKADEKPPAETGKKPSSFVSIHAQTKRPSSPSILKK